MTDQDQYVLRTISKYSVYTGTNSPVMNAYSAMIPILRGWAGPQLIEIKPSGSHAKDTAVKGRTDLDLLISLKHDTQEPLKDLYHMLDRWMRNKGYTTRLQNVSVRINHSGVQVDLVPGVKHSGNSNYHWLYVSKSGKERTQTNIDLHIDKVKKSLRINEIKALKIWAQNHNLDFPSIYLELTAIKALSGHQLFNLAENVKSVLRHISQNLTSTTILDPANTNNIISADLTISEKQAIARQAMLSLLQPTWGTIIW